MPKVFISYNAKDYSIAKQVRDRVEQHQNFTTYFDRIDDADMTDGPSLAKKLRQRMCTCDQLVAIVSRKTVTSWWVPWEIGVGFERKFRMASYLIKSSSGIEKLPSYLNVWPKLQSMSDVDKYCKNSTLKFHDVSPRSGIMQLAESRDPRITGQISERDQVYYFHEKLKQDLGQTE